MDRNQYINGINSILENNFQLYRGVHILNRNIDLYGKWTMEFGRNFLTKNTIIDKFECNEHCLVEGKTYLNEDNLEEFISYLKKCTLGIVVPHKDHKTTYITGVIVADKVDPKIKGKIKGFKYVKNYKLSLYGWSIVRLIVVDLENKEILNNRDAKEFAKSITIKKLEKLSKDEGERILV